MLLPQAGYGLYTVQRLGQEEEDALVEKEMRAARAVRIRQAVAAVCVAAA